MELLLPKKCQCCHSSHLAKFLFKLFNPLICLSLGVLLSFGLCHADQDTDKVDENTAPSERSTYQVELSDRAPVKESANSNNATAQGGNELPSSKSINFHLLMFCFVGSLIAVMTIYQTWDLVLTRLASKEFPQNV